MEDWGVVQRVCYPCPDVSVLLGRDLGESQALCWEAEGKPGLVLKARNGGRVSRQFTGRGRGRGSPPFGETGGRRGGSLEELKCIGALKGCVRDSSGEEKAGKRPWPAKGSAKGTEGVEKQGMICDFFFFFWWGEREVNTVNP